MSTLLFKGLSQRFITWLVGRQRPMKTNTERILMLIIKVVTLFLERQDSLKRWRAKTLKVRA